MFWINPYSQRNQRQRWIRPLEEAKAREAQEWEAFGRELAEVRREWEELKREIAARRAARLRDAEALRRKSDVAWKRFLQTFKRYAEQQKAGFNPDRPRAPKGDPDGGRWTRDAGKEGDDHARSTDISAQRRIGPRPIGTPAQHLRLDIANARAREAIARTQQLDPHWRPASLMSRDNPTDMEAMIRAKEAEKARSRRALPCAVARGTGHALSIARPANDGGGFGAGRKRDRQPRSRSRQPDQNCHVRDF